MSLIGNIYTKASTTFVRTLQCANPTCTISKVTNLNPYLFLVFFESLLHWVDEDDFEYHLNTSNAHTNSIAYAYGLSIIFQHLPHLQSKIIKLEHFDN